MPNFIQSKDGLSIAYNFLRGKTPTVMFMPGFFSNMQGTKALWLEKRCKERGQAYVRFDYRGHGRSDGKFEDGTITDWLNDTLLILDQIVPKPVVAVGSSMGGWIAVLAALNRPDAVAGLVGVASSPDFTQSIYEERMNVAQREEIVEKGFIKQPSDYQDNPVIITRKLIEDGNNHLLLNRDKLKIDIPVILIHGKKDADVSWKKSFALQQRIGKEYCKLILVPDGKHRLSRPQDLDLIDQSVMKISGI